MEERKVASGETIDFFWKIWFYYNRIFAFLIKIFYKNLKKEVGMDWMRVSFFFWYLNARRRIFTREGICFERRHPHPFRMKLNICFGFPIAVIFGEDIGLIFIQSIPWWKVRLWWYQLYIRKDEFHPSLSIDPFAFVRMAEREKEEYLGSLCRRRIIAHQRDTTR